jgi:hypothetical protein
LARWPAFLFGCTFWVKPDFVVHRADNLQALLLQFDQPEEADLLQWTRSLMFQASLPALFGPRFAAENPDCEHFFYEMEEEFELATTPIPHFFLKKFSRGKKSLLRILKRLVETTNSGNGEATMIAALIKVSCQAFVSSSKLLIVFSTGSSSRISSKFFGDLFVGHAGELLAGCVLDHGPHPLGCRCDAASAGRNICRSGF